ncbi:hypothetical protein [Streptomyces hygroscopicus]|uniref:hypothetical protein n=1 Tax=Streptomyces hygroscopicus TaxID=1912 RepID=UPI003F1C9C9A
MAAASLKVIHESMNHQQAHRQPHQDPKAANPTGQPNDSNSGGKSKDGSSVPFGLIPSVAFLVLSFAGYLIA